ncbi:MAG TPA: TraR/DksA C4-type zinc finger protein [bacterium]|nr:TraR/DksA C4-type zinc finger protein [bacterium]HPT29551.1 TraR/DksA C4-type zinc finger protein [bacterium]
MTELDKATIEQIKADLLRQKEQVLKDLGDVSKKDSHEPDNMNSKFPEYGDKPDENAQEISEYTANIATEKVLEDSLKDIDSALKRIEKGEYGICKYCHKSIDPKRLIARPTASSCIQCKTELQAE